MTHCDLRSALNCLPMVVLMIVITGVGNGKAYFYAM